MWLPGALLVLYTPAQPFSECVGILGLHYDCAMILDCARIAMIDLAWSREGWDVLVFEGLIEVARSACLPGVQKECSEILDCIVIGQVVL